MFRKQSSWLIQLWVACSSVCMPNALVQLQAHYRHCGEAASEKCCQLQRSLCGVGDRASDSFLRIRKKPLDAATRSACERRRATIRPIQIQERHSRCVQLCPTFDETVACAMSASHRLPDDGVALTCRSFPHRLHSALYCREEFAHVSLRVGES